MKASTTLCLAALLALAACDRHDSEATRAPESAASDNSAFLEGGQHAEAAGSEAGLASAPAPHADRGPPPEVPPIVRDGLRYAQGESMEAALTWAEGECEGFLRS